jgi:class 3 adenylate cyclase
VEGTIHVEQARGADLEHFLEDLRSLRPPGGAESAGHSFAFVVFWGPPGAQPDELKRVLAGLPPGVPAIGCSTEDYIDTGRYRHGGWLAVAVSSPHLTAHTAHCELSAQGTPESADQIQDSIRHFISQIPEPYRRDGKQIPADREGAHGVRYRRPAMLLVFLPGIGGGDLTPDWPTGNRDYQVVETIGSKLSQGVTMFGGSASPGIEPRPRPWQRPWLAASDERGQRSHYKRGVVGLLVETDLAFGVASEHGLKANTAVGFLVNDVVRGAEAGDPALPSSSPSRYHRVRLSPPAEPPPVELHRLDGPASSGSPRYPDKGPWNTLVAFADDFDEPEPNPPYRTENEGEIALLRPVSKGTTLYQASATEKELVDAGEQALRKAIANGEVHAPYVSLMMNCRGRLFLLGKRPVELELEQAHKVFGDRMFGIYGAGETSSSSRGRHRHHTWTVAALVLGQDFHDLYRQAAQWQLVSRINQKAASLTKLDDVLAEIVESTQILLQAFSCHIWILSDDEQKLCYRRGVGPVAEIAPRELGLDDPELAKTLPIQAFKTGEHERISRDEYNLLNMNIKWNAKPADVRVVVQSVGCWLAVPVIDRNECLAVVSIALSEPTVDEHKLKLAIELAQAAALPIRTSMMRTAFISALNKAATTKSAEELATAMLDEGTRMLPRRCYLALLLPDPPSEPKKLICMDVRGPTKIDLSKGHVDLGAQATKPDKGICGWVFEKRKPFCSDDVRKDANGEGDRPLFKELVPDAVANYVFPLLDPDAPGAVALGVLNAEAAAGVLDQGVHLPLLASLAEACGVAVSRLNRERQLSEVLKGYAPSVVRQFEEGGVGALLAAVVPTKMIVSILHVDIRGFTAMSEIVGEERISDFIDAYYGMIATAVAGTRGIVDRFTGDGALALFGTENAIDSVFDKEDVPGGVQKSLENAVLAGLDVANGFGPLAQKWLRRWRRECPQIEEGRRFEVGVVVHLGKPLVGFFHRKMTPSLGHGTYTAIGRDVNLTSRVGAVVDGNKVFVTSSAWEVLRGSGRFVFREAPRPVRKLKGIAQKLEIHRVEDPGAAGSPLGSDEYDDGLS